MFEKFSLNFIYIIAKSAIILVLAVFLMKFCPNIINFNLKLVSFLKFDFSPSQIIKMSNENILAGEIFEYCIKSGIIIIIFLELISFITNFAIKKIIHKDINKKDISNFFVGILENSVAVMIIFILINQISSEVSNGIQNAMNGAYKTLYSSIMVTGQLLFVKSWFKYDFNFVKKTTFFKTNCVSKAEKSFDKPNNKNNKASKFIKK